MPHVTRARLRNATLHVTLRLRKEVWNLRSRRCFQALKHAFAAGCVRFGCRLIHFSVQGNHIHAVVEAPDAVSLGRAMKGLEVRMARALNRVMGRKGAVFADRYHVHILKSPKEAWQAVRYVLDNWVVHALREGRPAPKGIDPYCSNARHTGPPLVASAVWWLLRVGVERAARERAVA